MALFSGLRLWLGAFALAGGVAVAGVTVLSAQNVTEIKEDGLPWLRHGVVVERGEPGALDDNHLESPIVVRESADQLVMWYRGRKRGERQEVVMRAVSSDGLEWTKTGLVMEAEADYEGRRVDPMTIVRDDDGYRMWYGAASAGGSANLAFSPDGIMWSRHDGNPILTKTTRRWDNKGAGGHHTVYLADDQWTMIYKGYGFRDGWTAYGLATSRDGVRWRKRARVITPEPDQGENTLFRNMSGFYRHGHHFVIHAMAGKEKNLNLRLLHSENGRNWTRAGVIFQKGRAPGGFDVKWATSPTIMFEDGKLRMWYEGGDANGRVRVLYAEIAEEDFFGHLGIPMTE